MPGKAGRLVKVSNKDRRPVKATSALTEKDKLKSDLAAASSAISRDSAVSVESSSSTEELTTLQAKIEELQTQLSEVMVLTI